MAISITVNNDNKKVNKPNQNGVIYKKTDTKSYGYINLEYRITGILNEKTRIGSSLPLAINKLKDIAPIWYKGIGEPAKGKDNRMREVLKDFYLPIVHNLIKKRLRKNYDTLKLKWEEIERYINKHNL